MFTQLGHVGCAFYMKCSHNYDMLGNIVVMADLIFEERTIFIIRNKEYPKCTTTTYVGWSLDLKHINMAE